MSMPSPESIPEAFAEGWNSNDAEAIAALFADDAEFVNVVGMWWHNRERIRRAHAIALESYFRDANVEVERTKVRYLSDDIATIHWRWRMSGQVDPSGERASERTGIFTMVAQRGPDGWLVAAAQNTDIVPGSESILADGTRRTGVRYG